MKSRPTPPPVPLDSRERIVAALRVLNGAPLVATETLAVLRLLAGLAPDDGATWRAELEALYPTIRASRDKLKCLALAADLLAPTERPASFGEQVLLEMARDDG